MGKILCFISDDFADFEITLAFHKIKNVGKREVLTVGYQDQPVVSESGLRYQPDLTISQAMELQDVEGLVIPGGPIREQKEELTALIVQLDKQGMMLAAVCHGPQYLGRAGVLAQRSFTTSCSVERIHQMGVANPFPRENFLDQRVVRDGHIITAQGRAFVDFSFAIFDYLGIYAGREDEKHRLYADIMDR